MGEGRGEFNRGAVTLGEEGESSHMVHTKMVCDLYRDVMLAKVSIHTPKPIEKAATA
jgi:hypothetical protein